MPAAIPAPLASLAERLLCPVCGDPLAPAAGSLICPRGHSHDVAREGYVALLPPALRPATGDDAAMIAARGAILGAGHFEPLTATLADAARTECGLEPSVVLDVGAGTGHHLARMLDVLSHARGIALDASRHASRRAARAHDRIAAVRGDVWKQVPLGNGSIDLAVSVFAPRNGPELARVLRPGGAFIAVTPRAEHLRELVPLHTIGIDPRKSMRLHRQLAGGMCAGEVRRLTWTLKLTRDEAAALVRMGPSARHVRPDWERRLASLPEPAHVTAALELRTFRRRSD